MSVVRPRCAFARGLTARGSAGVLRIVLGVFPRSLPGVLKASAMFLPDVSDCQSGVREELVIRMVLVEDSRHVLVEPVQFVSRGEGKLLDLRLYDL